MIKKHAFVPGVVQIRRSGGVVSKLSHCAICGQIGRETTREIRGRNVTYWTHRTRPAEEPTPAGVCEWQGTGGLWCCKPHGHAAGHHAHRGPRRDGVR